MCQVDCNISRAELQARKMYEEAKEAARISAETVCIAEEEEEEPNAVFIERQKLEERRNAADYLQGIYQRIDQAKAERISSCGNYVVIAGNDNFAKVVDAHFCRVRLCPICIWRRSMKLRKQLYDITQAMGADYGYIFITLTVPNCTGAGLRLTINQMQDAFRRFLQRPEIKRICKGYYRGVEVTRDTDRTITLQRYNRAKRYYDAVGFGVGDVNINYDTYHPHYHIAMAVPRAYFTSRDYIRRARLQQIWTDCMRLDVNMIVDIRACKDYKNAVQPQETDTDEGGLASTELGGALLEVTKYSIKPYEYLTGDVDEDKETVTILDRELDGLRFVSMGGVIKAVHKALHLTDSDSPEYDREGSISGKVWGYTWAIGVTGYRHNTWYARQYARHLCESSSSAAIIEKGE